MNKKRNYAKLEHRIIELEKRVAALEVPVQAQPVTVVINSKNTKTPVEIEADLKTNLYQLAKKL